MVDGVEVHSNLELVVVVDGGANGSSWEQEGDG